MTEEDVDDASSVADKISRRKKSTTMSDGAKQADPQTVPVDLEVETEEIKEEVSQAKTSEEKKKQK